MRVTAELEFIIMRLVEERRCSVASIGAELGLSRATIRRIIAHHHRQSTRARVGADAFEPRAEP